MPEMARQKGRCPSFLTRRQTEEDSSVSQDPAGMHPLDRKQTRVTGGRVPPAGMGYRSEQGSPRPLTVTMRKETWGASPHFADDRWARPTRHLAVCARWHGRTSTGASAERSTRPAAL